jgi:hypothetical protein
MISALKRRHVDPRVIELAKTFKCPYCEERRPPDPRHQSSLEPIPNKWTVVQSDVGHWIHPALGDKWSFGVFVDEGCRFVVGDLYFNHKTRHVNWELLKKTYETRWWPYFGQMKTLRVDPDGAWRGNQPDQYFSERGVLLEPIPAEAHWQISLAERSIQEIKRIMTALVEEFSDMAPQEAFTRALWARNRRDQYLGFSPFQHAMGLSPDDDGNLGKSQLENLPLSTDSGISGEFGHNVRAMVIAEKAFLDEQAHQRLLRAERSGHRRTKDFVPGDLVYYWRKQVLAKDGPVGFKGGKFLGPARVLATETKPGQGNLRPGSIIWITRAGRLLRASPEQLRPASFREAAIEEIKSPINLPWTFSKLLQDVTDHTYTDISQEVPNENEWKQEMTGLQDEDYQKQTISSTWKKHATTNSQRPLNFYNNQHPTT